ncbi:MAG: GNAT family N-acetyltransferase [Armatimonadetes bacterium]|nr:GNAT family N-acetyltransferase [Armatimonadota bacterium]
MLFETERLLVRRLTHEDAEAMFAIYGDPEASIYIADGDPLPPEDCHRWVDVTDKNFAVRGYGMVAFADKATGEVIGCGGIVHPNQQPEPEVKYAFRRDKWGQGYASEAIRGLIGFGKANWGIGRLIATVHPDNRGSQNVLTKLGFQLTETRTEEDGSHTQVWELN